MKLLDNSVKKAKEAGIDVYLNPLAVTTLSDEKKKEIYGNISPFLTKRGKPKKLRGNLKGCVALIRWLNDLSVMDTLFR